MTIGLCCGWDTRTGEGGEEDYLQESSSQGLSIDCIDPKEFVEFEETWVQVLGIVSVCVRERGAGEEAKRQTWKYC